MKDVISVDTILDWNIHMLVKQAITQDISETKKLKLTQEMIDEAKSESKNKLHSLLISKLPEHMTYGENIKLKGSTTQKYIKEKTGEVTGFNKAVLEMRKSIDELFEVGDV